MPKSLKFLGFFMLFFIPVFAVVGGASLLGVALSSAFCTFAAEKLSQSITQVKRWRQIVFCAGICAAIAATFFCLRMYLLAMVIGVTGSPYEVPDINYLRIFLLVFISALIPTAAVLTVFRYRAAQRPLR